MFEQSMLETSGAVRQRNAWAMVASLGLQSLFIAVLLLIPLTATEAVPLALRSVRLDVPMGRDPEPPAPAAPKPAATQVAQSEVQEGRIVTPIAIPNEVFIPAEPEAALPPSLHSGPPGPIPGGLPGGVPFGTGSHPLIAPPPPPVKPAEPARPAAPVRVHSSLQDAKAISRPTPVYPELAKRAGIQGTVRMEAIISRDGTIESLRVTSGHTLLVKAAVDAVRQWRYRPTILNGEPVEVQTTIEVNFMLSR
jgi:protein TonB